MAVAYDATGPTTAHGVATPTTWSHTCGAGVTELIVAVNVDNYSVVGTVAATYNSVSMTPLGSQSNGNGFLYLFGLANPTTGSALTVSASATGTFMDIVGASISTTGTSSLGSFFSGTGTSITSSVTLTSSTSGGLCIGFAAVGNIIASTTSPSTSRMIDNFEGTGGGNTGNLAAATSPSTGSAVTMAWGNTTAADSWVAAAIEVAPPSTEVEYQLVGTIGAPTALTASGGTASPAYGQSPTLGNLLIAQVSGFTTSTLPATPGGWTIAKQETGTSCSASTFYKVAAGGDAAPTFAIASTICIAMLGEFTVTNGGTVPANPVDQTSVAAATTSPLVATNGAADAAIGELMVSTGAFYYSGANSKTITDTYTNSTAIAQGNHATSKAEHEDFAYGITTANAVADADSLAFTTTAITGACLALVSFKFAAPSTSVGTNIVTPPAVHRRWPRRGFAWFSQGPITPVPQALTVVSQPVKSRTWHRLGVAKFLKGPVNPVPLPPIHVSPPHRGRRGFSLFLRGPVNVVRLPPIHVVATHQRRHGSIQYLKGTVPAAVVPAAPIRVVTPTHIRRTGRIVRLQGATPAAVVTAPPAPIQVVAAHPRRHTGAVRIIAGPINPVPLPLTVVSKPPRPRRGRVVCFQGPVPAAIPALPPPPIVSKPHRPRTGRSLYLRGPVNPVPVPPTFVSKPPRPRRGRVVCFQGPVPAVIPTLPPPPIVSRPHRGRRGFSLYIRGPVNPVPLPPIKVVSTHQPRRGRLVCFRGPVPNPTTVVPIVSKPHRARAGHIQYLRGPVNPVRVPDIKIVQLYPPRHRGLVRWLRGLVPPPPVFAVGYLTEGDTAENTVTASHTPENRLTEGDEPENTLTAVATAENILTATDEAQNTLTEGNT